MLKQDGRDPEGIGTGPPHLAGCVGDRSVTCAELGSVQLDYPPATTGCPLYQLLQQVEKVKSMYQL